MSADGSAGVYAFGARGIAVLCRGLSGRVKAGPCSQVPSCVQGAAANATDMNGSTPLHDAAAGGACARLPDIMCNVLCPCPPAPLLSMVARLQ